MTEPKLCDYHHAVIRDLQRKDHIGDEDSAHVARALAKACPDCLNPPRSTRRCHVA